MKDVYRLKLASGREVKATANHPFLAFRLDRPGRPQARRPGSHPGAGRQSALLTGLGWSPLRIGLLAHLIGDGSHDKRLPSALFSAVLMPRSACSCGTCGPQQTVVCGQRAGKLAREGVLRLLKPRACRWSRPLLSPTRYHRADPPSGEGWRSSRPATMSSWPIPPACACSASVWGCTVAARRQCASSSRDATGRTPCP